jgi:hypothetical protein
VAENEDLERELDLDVPRLDPSSEIMNSVTSQALSSSFALRSKMNVGSSRWNSASTLIEPSMLNLPLFANRASEPPS